jgi:crotonobetainyl-CoA:carnitine CoA-transferase CaiB-like acyl-CoA transferase
VLYENNATDLMEKLGITYEWLSSINPRVIFIRAPAFGNTGERRDIRAYGTQVEALMGHTLLRGYPDLDPTSTSTIFTSDIFAGLNGAFTVLAALHARDRTGEGQLIEVAQAECSMAILAEAFLDYSLNGRVNSTLGNRDYHGAVQGVYRCAGPDDWVAISIETDDQWSALADLVGRPGLATDSRFGTRDERYANHDEIDRIIGEWTAQRDKREATALLQERGIAAGPVMNAKDAYEDPHIAERGFFETVIHRNTGTYPWPGMPFKLSETPLHVRRPPRDLGEDNDYVYRQLLGVSDEEYAELVLEGHIGTEFDEGL